MPALLQDRITPIRTTPTRTTPTRTTPVRTTPNRAAPTLSTGGGTSTGSSDGNIISIYPGERGTSSNPSSPLNYSQPYQNLRTGGDVTNINAFGDPNKSSMDRVLQSAGSQIEATRAAMLAQTYHQLSPYGMSQQEAYSLMFGSPDERKGVASKYGRIADQMNNQGMAGYTPVSQNDFFNSNSAYNKGNSSWTSAYTMNPFTGKSQAWYKPQSQPLASRSYTSLF